MSQGGRMDSKKATAILAISLMLLQAIVLMLPGIDTAGENQGTASHDGVSVSYIDSSNPGYGILTVSFSDKPGADYFTVSIDGGMTSAPIPVNPGMFAVPGGLSIGTHTLRVVCGDDDWHIAITVAEVIHATGVTIDYTSVPMTVGETIVLKASVVPADAVEKDIVWNSSNTSVATVSNGTVKAVSAGTAVITASVGDLKATCSISVSDSPHVHTWDSGTVTKKPTCTEPGIKTYKCSCGETRTETIPALGHKWSEWTVVKEATEKEDGLKERTCSVCGEKEQQIIPKTGVHVHTWDSGTVTKKPTCTEPGIKTYKCSCGETRTETIPTLGHKWSEWTVVKEATEKEDGLKERTCSVCGEKETSIIPKIVIVDNGDGTTTRTEEAPDGTIVKTTTGAADGSTKVEKKKAYTDKDGNRMTVESSEIFDRNGNRTGLEKKVEARSEDGSVSSTATITAGNDDADVVTVVGAGSGSGVVSGELIDKALALQERIVREIAGDAKNHERTLHIEVSASDADLILQQDSVGAVSGSGSALRISSGNGSVTLPKQVMSGITGKGDIAISFAKARYGNMSDAQKAAVSDGTAVDVTIASGGVSLGNALGGTITLSVKHVPAGGKTPVAYFIAEDGSKERMDGTSYDPETGMVSFDTTHCSLYAVIDEDPGSSGTGIVLYVCIAIAAFVAIAAVALVIKRRP